MLSLILRAGFQLNMITMWYDKAIRTKDLDLTEVDSYIPLKRFTHKDIEGLVFEHSLNKDGFRDGWNCRALLEIATVRYLWKVTFPMLEH